MKRAIATIMLTVMAVSFPGCGKKQQQPETTVPETTAVQTIPSEITAAETIPSENTQPLPQLAVEDRLVLAYEEMLYNAPAEYYYDTQGRPVRKVQAQWNIVTEYEYDGNGTLIRETRLEDGELLDAIEYDAYGNLLAEYMGGFDDNGDIVPELMEKYENTYDEQGRLLETVQTSLNTGTDAVWGVRKLYTYHEDGSYDMEYSDYYDAEGRRYPHCHWIYTYTAEGKRIKVFRDLDDMTELYAASEYSLDEKGNYQTLRLDYEYNGKAEWTDTVYQNSYNAEGQLIRTEIMKRSFDGVQETPMAFWQTITREYDDAGRLILETFVYADNGYTKQNIWEYDKAGNLLYFSGEYEDGDDTYDMERRCEYKLLSQLLYQE